jgi:hypothetical protein
MTASRRCHWCGVELAGRSHRQFCSAPCRLRGHRAQKHAESEREAAESVSVLRDDSTPVRRRETLSLAIPDSLDAESRRVVEYVNGEIERWNAGLRTEPIDLILEAARERLRRARS